MLPFAAAAAADGESSDEGVDDNAAPGSGEAASGSGKRRKSSRKKPFEWSFNSGSELGSLSGHFWVARVDVDYLVKLEIPVSPLGIKSHILSLVT